MTELEYVRMSGNSVYYGFETMSLGILFCLLMKIILGKEKIKYYQYYIRLLVSDILLISVHLIRISKLYSVYRNIDIAILLLFYSIFAFGVYNIFKFYCTIIHIQEIHNIKSKLFFASPVLISLQYIFTDENAAKACFGLITFGIVIIMTCYMIFYCLVICKSYADRLYIVFWPMVPIILVYMHVGNPAIPLGSGITLSALIGYILSVDLLISVDSLTNTNNRQNLYKFLSQKMKHSSNDLHVMMIDGDKFKQINDTYGHIEGDRCLIRIADSIKIACDSLPKRAFVCRYGGDEFLVACDCSFDDFSMLEYNIKKELDKANSLSKCKVYVSAGIATHVAGTEETIYELINRADEELYRKKNKKRKFYKK